MTLMQPFYEKEAYNKGYEDGLASASEKATGPAAAMPNGGTIDHVRAGMIESMKESYEAKLGIASRQGYFEGKVAGYKAGYSDGHADGYEEGRAAGRMEHIDLLMLPGESTAAARLQGRKEIASHLCPILAQIKEGTPVASAIAERIEAVVIGLLNSNL